VFALGAMTDQNHLGPKAVLTSVTWDLGPLVTAVGKAVEDKSWKSQNWSFGIPEGSVKLADFHGLDAGVPPEVLKAVSDKFEAIKSGAFTVPLDTSNVN
jgi:basic membrane protein A